MAPRLSSLFAIGLGCLTVVEAAKVVPMKVGQRRSTGNALTKRDTIQASLQNYLPAFEYYITVEIGTPGQTLDLIVDTGSSDVWTFKAGDCTASKSSPCEGGSFKPAMSSTYEDLIPNAFEISYIDGSGVTGDYIGDDFAIGGVTVKNLTMGLATESKDNYSGVMGIGLDVNEALFNSVPDAVPYPNLPDELIRQDLIGYKAYSLYLDDLAAKTGQILFGGYDTSKYQGNLTMMPLVQTTTSGEVTEFAVAWTNFALTNSKGVSTSIMTDAFPMAAVLDSGSSKMLLPENLFYALAGYFNATDYEGLPRVPCDLGTGSLDFTFGGSGGAIVRVAFSELTNPFYDPFTGEPYTDGNGNTICQLGIQGSSGGTVVLGQTFIRSAYILYDLDGLQAGIAASNFDSSNSNVKEYTGSASDIKTVTSAPGISFSAGGSSQVGFGPQSSFNGGYSYSASQAIAGISFRETTISAPTPTPNDQNVETNFQSLTANNNRAAGSIAPSAFASTVAMIGFFTLAFVSIGGVVLL